MQFNSYLFILVYLPALFVGYFVCNRINAGIGKIFMAMASAVFYIYGGWDIAAVLGISIIVNLVLSILISRTTRWKKTLLALDITTDIGLLFYYKYYNFFIENINTVLEQGYSYKEIILPLGISFFTFQQVMYVVNVYKGDIEKVNILDYLVYILYFPKILMGPIVEPGELIAQFNDEKNKSIDWDNVSCGIKLFSYGLFKKMILAESFQAAVTWGYSNVDTSTALDWFLIMLFYTFEIYFDFSGYSDMAVGISHFFNISLPINFDSPYKAISIRDFWKRWHISLTGFLTRYIYIPFGGSKKGKIRTYVNTMAVFLISGIWHGAKWTFILWGALHGAFSVLGRIFEKQEKRLFRVIKWGGSFLIINILWLLFRSDSIEQWWHLVLKMFTFQKMTVSEGLLTAFVLPEATFILKQFPRYDINLIVGGVCLTAYTVTALGICLIPENNFKKQKDNNWVTMIMAAIAFVWSFLCLSSESVFVYNSF